MEDFAKQLEENNKLAEQRAREEAERVSTEYGISPDTEVQPVPELRDDTNAVGSDGRVSNQNAPGDSTVQSESQNTQQPTRPTPAPERATEPATPKSSAVLTDSKSFEGKKHSFLDPDEEKGLWGTLDKKVKEALQGGSPEEIGTNAFFAAMTFVCELVTNYANHLRHERKRLAKEYKENVAKNDEIMGIAQTHKNLAIWAAIADHPAMRQYAGKPINKEMRKAAYKLYRSDATAQKNAILLVSSMCGRKLTRDEANTYFEKAFKAEFGDATLENVKNAALNNEKVLAGLALSGLKDEIFRTHREVRSHGEDIARNQADRTLLNQARQGQQSTQTQTHTRTQGRDAA